MQETGDVSSIPGWGRSPGGGNGNSLQYSCWEKPMDRGALWAAVCRVSKSQTQLSDCSSPGSSVRGILQARKLRVGSHYLLQGIFPIQGLNLCLLHLQAKSLPVSHQEALK